MSSSAYEPLPVTLVTGFLGAGKTTLLNHILNTQHGIKTAVLVNEFGEIGIDQDLIVSNEGGIVEMNNGCICCTINHDLVETISRILERRSQLDYLIVETTGLADPFPIAMTFVGKDLSPYLRLDSIITLVDAENFGDELVEEPAVYNQIKYADILLLNKADLVSSKDLRRCRDKLKTIKTDARILETTHAKIALPLILGIESFASSELIPSLHVSHGHLENFMSVSVEYDRPFDVNRFQEFLVDCLPETAYRAKGILWVSNNNKRNVFHLTGRRFTIERTEWGLGPQKSFLVFIGQNLNEKKIKQQLASCLLDT